MRSIFVVVLFVIGCGGGEKPVEADLKVMYQRVLPEALAHMKRASQARREAIDTAEIAALREALPALDAAIAAVEGFEAKTDLTRDLRDGFARAFRGYRAGLAKSADALEAGDQGLLDEANAMIEAAQEDVVVVETRFHREMVDRGMLR